MSIKEAIRESVWQSELVELVIYNGKEVPAIVNIGSAAAVRKNFFRNTTVNDAVRDEAEFTFLAEDIQGFKPGDKIIHQKAEWRVDKLSLWDTIADTIVLACSKNNKGFARGFEK